MPLFETTDQVISAVIIWLLGFLLLESIRKIFGLGFRITHLLYIWHTLFCLVYAIYAQTHTSDANVYYMRALIGDTEWGFGTKFIVPFSSLFVIPLHLSAFGIYLVFNIIGSLGILSFYASLKVAVQNKSIFIQRLAVIMVFLPSINFWSVALGKEPFALMSAGFALWAALNMKRRIWLMIFAIFIMGMIRPHIAGIFVIALSIAFVSDKKISLFPRLALLSLSLIAISIMVPFALQYAGLEDISQGAKVVEFVEIRQSYNQQGGGGIDISTMSLPVQMFTYIFRPLPMDAHSVSALFASIDNLFLFLLFLLFLRGIYKNKNIKNEYNIIFMVSFIMATWLILAVTTANLGIAIRQKWMFLPFLIFLFFLHMRSLKIKFYKYEI